MCIIGFQSDSGWILTKCPFKHDFNGFTCICFCTSYMWFVITHIISLLPFRKQSRLGPFQCGGNTLKEHLELSLCYWYILTSEDVSILLIYIWRCSRLKIILPSFMVETIIVNLYVAYCTIVSVMPNIFNIY